MHRMIVLLLLLWAGATVSTVLDLQKRIIGGTDCERKYHVKVVDINNNFVCGGSLISNEWILTAEHCDEPVLQAQLHPYGGTPKEITDHVPYKDKGKTHDIMLLKLKHPVQVITPVNLPDCGKQPKEKDEVELAGHTKEITGRDGKKECDETDHLQCIKAPVISCDPYLDCIKKSYAATEAHNQHLFCADTQKVNTCEGNSGGGVVYNGMIYGVHMGSGDPGSDMPMAYMKVCEYKECKETDQLQCTKAPVISCNPDLDCIKKSILSEGDQHAQHLFCADTQKVNACEGNSGGGVVYNGMIYGVHMGSGDPGSTLPMLLTKVCKYKDWTNAQTGLEFP